MSDVYVARIRYFRDEEYWEKLKETCCQGAIGKTPLMELMNIVDPDIRSADGYDPMALGTFLRDMQGESIDFDVTMENGEIGCVRLVNCTGEGNRISQMLEQIFVYFLERENMKAHICVFFDEESGDIGNIGSWDLVPMKAKLDLFKNGEMNRRMISKGRIVFINRSFPLAISGSL